MYSRLDALTDFNPAMARRLAAAAVQVYQPAAVVEQFAIENWDIRQTSFLDVESTQCFITADVESIVVAFRGTESREVEDWVVDLDYDLIDGPLGGQVHEGFYGALSKLWSLLDREVARLQRDRPRKLWVTGHSLGAALACLATARWVERGTPIEGLYTFGQPRTGDSDFARNFDFVMRSRTFRVVNHLDIVTRTPPRALGYRHLGTLIYLTEDGKIDSDVTWWERFVNGWGGAIENILNWCREGISDHSMLEYQQLLEAAPIAAPRRLRIFDPAAEPAERIRPRRRAA